MKQAVTMKTQAETEQENDSKSTENQNHFQYSILNQPTTKKGPIGLLLIVASIVASGSGLIFGYELADISGALLQLSTEFHLTCAKQEIIVSAIIMGGIVGSLSSGYIIDRWERRMGIIVTSCCYILGAVILSASTSYAMLMGGRIIVGIGTTSGVIAACIYLSEVAPPDRRGMLVSLTEFMTVIGVLLAYVFNYTFSRISNGWRYMFAIVIPIAVLQVIGIFFLPPSPRFMVKKGNDEKASLVLKKIRSYSNVDDELANIKSSLTNENNYNFLDLFRSNNLRMRFCIGFGLAIFLQATGQPNVLFYASTILRSVGFASDSTATLASVSIGLVKVLGTILAMLLIDKVGRKTFLCIGSTIIVVSLIILALLIHKIPMQFTDICHYPNHTNRWQDNITSSMLGQHSVAVTALPSRTDFLSSVTKQDNMTIMQNVSSSPFTESPEVDGHRNEPIPPVLKWLCLCSLLVYVAAYSISFGPELIGLMWVLLIYAIVSFIGLPFIIFIVPETKGQTLEEISEQLNQGYNRTPICCTTEHIKRLIPGIFRKQRDASCEKKLMEKLNVRCQLSSMESPCRLSTTLSSCLYPQKIYKTLIPSCLQKVVLCGLCLCPKHRLSCTLDAA
ncbi:solute carrier family 2, facilitated glucose transporter member 12 isoform X3 [Chiloscyllium plagiosum]|uniref:solute carrier family 2, facilitated glucose transporter member 12 isoform X3 n=1 Tax=Chiloscyllium plagiosum TaxID=36176 RepID=UPI001CB7B6A6|nr:solute carrier family 2, facilitated glucose transporter member 12 isoform X3 [Chiloscyllium plagiosum]